MITEYGTHRLDRIEPHILSFQQFNPNLQSHPHLLLNLTWSPDVHLLFFLLYLSDISVAVDQNPNLDTIDARVAAASDTCDFTSPSPRVSSNSNQLGSHYRLVTAL